MDVMVVMGRINARSLFEESEFFMVCLSFGWDIDEKGSSRCKFDNSSTWICEPFLR